MNPSEKYLDMLIYQSALNEQKLGASADSVSDKIRDIKSIILENQKLRELIEKRINNLIQDIKFETDSDMRLLLNQDKTLLQSVLDEAITNE